MVDLNSVTSVPERPDPSSDFCQHQAHTKYIYLHAGETLTHMEENKQTVKVRIKVKMNTVYHMPCKRDYN